jgi:hypothetical protein
MTTFDAVQWQALNARALVARLARVKALLRQVLDADTAAPPPVHTDDDAQSSIGALAALFGLTPFEVDLLMLCAGVELDTEIVRLCAEINGDPRRINPTFALALTALPDAHWSALSPSAALRYWRLIDVRGSSDTLTHAPLHVDERVLHFIVGVHAHDSRLDAVVQELPPLNPPASDDTAQRAAALLSANQPPVIALAGADRGALTTLARAATALTDRRLFSVRAGDLPLEAAERTEMARRWSREAHLSGAVLLAEADGSPDSRRALAGFVDGGNFPVIVVSAQPVHLESTRHVVHLATRPPSAAQQDSAWARAFHERGLNLNGFAQTLAGQFQLSDALIGAAVDDALLDLPADAPDEQLERRLWDACRLQARPALDDLAQRIETGHTWDDLVLPDEQMTTLQEIVAHVAHRRTVYQAWGFERQSRGLGTSVVFAGSSGTGKTLAAEIIANALDLDLYRVDLSGVVSKYIGETEKNLQRIFNAAAYGGAILLFDEADALFGKRSEVRDSHDRYANIEVSYLLQQMETYRGLAILTTNMLENFDRAFLRRLRFIVRFPFPTPEQRAAIWARMFPPAAPTRDLDLHKLARLNVTGGSIQGIALNAAFLAASEGRPIQMKHLLRAASSEYAKLDKPLPDAEIRDWYV